MAKKAKTKRLILPASDKGGVGKSFFSVALVDWLKQHPESPSWAAFDPDDSNRTLMRFHPETTFLDIEQDSGLDPCFTALTDVDTAVVDGVGSRQKTVFLKWVEEVSLFDLADQMEIGLTYYLVIEDGTDVITAAHRIMTHIGDRVDWVAVLNHKQSKQFTLWYESSAHQLFRQLGGREINFECVNNHLIQFYDDTALPFSRCIDAPQVNILDQQRFRTIHAKLNTEFTAIEDLLVPAKPKEARKRSQAEPKAANGE